MVVGSFSIFLFSHKIKKKKLSFLLKVGAECSSVIECSFYDVVDDPTDTTWSTHWAFSCSNRISKTDVIKAMVCVILSEII